MKLDWMKLKTAVKSTATDIKKLKLEMRKSGHNPTWKEYKDLRNLKWEATRLCSLIAHARKRIHRKGMTYEEQAEYIGEGLGAFQLEEKAA